MLLHLLAASFQLGYRPAVSANVSAKYDTHLEYPLDVHTIYLVKLDQQPQVQQQADPDVPPTYDMAMGF